MCRQSNGRGAGGQARCVARVGTNDKRGTGQANGKERERGRERESERASKEGS